MVSVVANNNKIAGLEFPKKCIKEAVVWPMLRPDIFTGLRGPPKGFLLFGPPVIYSIDFFINAQGDWKGYGFLN